MDVDRLVGLVLDLRFAFLGLLVSGLAVNSGGFLLGLWLLEWCRDWGWFWILYDVSGRRFEKCCNLAGSEAFANASLPKSGCFFLCEPVLEQRLRAIAVLCFGVGREGYGLSALCRCMLGPCSS